MMSLLNLLSLILDLLSYLVIASVVMSWLVGFGVVNLHHPLARQFWYGLQRLTDPLLEPLRRVIPTFGGLDITPVILLLLLYFLKNLLWEYGRFVV